MPLTQEQEYTAKGMLSEGKEVSEIKKFLGLKNGNKWIEQMVASITEDSDDDLDSWKKETSDGNLTDDWQEVSDEAYGDLIKRGVKPSDAEKAIGEALSKMNLDADPDTEALVSVALSSVSVRNLLNVSTEKNMSITAMTGAGSATETQRSTRNLGARNSEDIFHPLGENGKLDLRRR